MSVWRCSWSEPHRSDSTCSGLSNTAALPDPGRSFADSFAFCLVFRLEFCFAHTDGKGLSDKDPGRAGIPHNGMCTCDPGPLANSLPLFQGRQISSEILHLCRR